MKKVTKALREEADELIRCGNSKEQCEGLGMVKVLNEIDKLTREQLEEHFVETFKPTPIPKKKVSKTIKVKWIGALNEEINEHEIEEDDIKILESLKPRFLKWFKKYVKDYYKVKGNYDDQRSFINSFKDAQGNKTISSLNTMRNLNPRWVTCPRASKDALFFTTSQICWQGKEYLFELKLKNKRERECATERRFRYNENFFYNYFRHLKYEYLQKENLI